MDLINFFPIIIRMFGGLEMFAILLILVLLVMAFWSELSWQSVFIILIPIFDNLANEGYTLFTLLITIWVILWVVFLFDFFWKLRSKS